MNLVNTIKSLQAKYVQEKYTYKAIEFGSRGHIPNSAAKIIANKYGDCKDHALLLHLLLKAVDVPSHLALVSTVGKIHRELPSLDQFNHIIVYVPGKSGSATDGRFIDTTDKGVDLKIKVPSYLGGEQTLVLQTEGGQLKTAPPINPDNNKVSVTRRIRNGKGKEKRIRVHETVEFIGYSASNYRGFFKSNDQKNQVAWIHRLLASSIASCDLKDLKVKNLHDNSKPLVLDYLYSFDGEDRDGSGPLTAENPHTWESEYLSLQPVKDRATPFSRRVPLSLESTTVFTRGPGVDLEIPELGSLKPKEETAPYASWKLDAQQKNSGVTLHFRFQLKNGQFPAKQYTQFYEMLNRAEKWISFKFSFK